jgi:enoyl-CoA hydratase
MKYKTLLVEERGKVVLLTVNRPQALNALNDDVISDLRDAIRRFSDREDIMVVVLTGGGDKAFVAGADLKHLIELSPKEVFEFVERGQELTFMIEKSPKVVIAMVNGYALGGGCELAMACDLIIASENAIFGQPEVNLGIIPGMGGTQRLPRLVGRNITKELVLTGDPIDAERAYQIGLANRVFSSSALLDETMKIAEKIASKAPFAIFTAKRAINQGCEASLNDGCYLEANSFALGFATQDGREGIGAFLEKRKPEFKAK